MRIDLKAIKNLIILLLIPLTAAFCGYHLSGTGSDLPEEIRTISIPDFKNNTTRHQAEQFVSNAIRDEFIKKSKVRLVTDSAKADALLEGTISRFETMPLSFSDSATAHLYRITIFLDVRLINLKNNTIIYQGEKIRFSETYDTEESDFFSQESESLKKISIKFARSIVSTILENF